MNKSLLSAIATKLNGDALNYTVFLDSLCLPLGAQSDPVQYVRSAFGGHAVVEELRAVATHKVIEEVESSLAYSGIEGAGPLKTTLASDEFKSLLQQLIAELRQMSERATKVWSFRLSEGHPAYPVFWDFAFLFLLPDTAVILIGSSSD